MGEAHLLVLPPKKRVKSLLIFDKLGPVLLPGPGPFVEIRLRQCQNHRLFLDFLLCRQ